MSTYTLTTPRGKTAYLEARDGTSDLAVLGSVFAGVAGSGLVDEYDLASLHVTGRFVDVGAHIGSVTIAVLLDNPDASAVCVEPIPENIDVLRANLRANGLTDRATVIEGAFGTDTINYGYVGSKTATVRQLELADILPADAIKLDCEGGEWAVLADPLIVTVPTIFGEYHGNPGSVGVTNALGRTHRITFADMTLSTGDFRAVER